MCYWYKIAVQINGTEQSGNGPCMYGQFTFIKGAKGIYQGNDLSFKQTVLEKYVK